ncbi:MAG: PEP-CTERM sorting domain-containing protein [Planctomycetota bacterium]|jgi:hypothetical protein
MRVTNKIRFLAFLVVATVFAQNASGTLAPMLSSSYYEGFVFYSENGLRGRIDFAVYDTEHAQYGDEYKDNGLEKPGEGQYIYAYQIFNDYQDSEEAVADFALLGINGVAIDIPSIGSQEDPEAGVASGSEYFDGDESKIVWEFNGMDGYIASGEHSWFLVFSSSHGPTKGDFEISGGDQVLVPAPEPSTVALLGLGMALAFMRRRRSAKVNK